jgi:hypothetical protein
MAELRPQKRGRRIDGELAPVELQFARKYLGGDEMVHDARHAWLRVTPRKINSWDFCKLPG